MKLYRFIYTSYLILMAVTSCQDELFQVPMEDNEIPVASENEIFLKREYSDYAFPAEKLTGLEGCRIRTKEKFVFLSDSVVRSDKPLVIEVEQNPYEEERLGELEFIDQEGTMVRSFSLRQASSLSQTQGEAYSNALQRSYGVGYGYDAFGEYASYNSVRDQVISLPALRRYEQEHKTACIVDDFAPDMETTILEGNDSQQLLKAFSAHAGLGLDVGFFQAHVEGKYSRSDLKTNAYSFCTIMNSYKAASRHVEPYNLVEIVRSNPNILTEGFRNIENKISNAVKINNLRDAAIYTEELFRIYGTHLIYHADLGGKLEFCSTFERAALDSQTTLSIAAEASFLNMCGFKMEEGQTNTYKQTSTRQSRSISARGGEVALTTQILNNEQDVLASGLVDKWYKSIKLDFNDPNNSNVELIDFKLFPIHELITDVAARSFIAAQLDEEIEYEDGMFPRTYDTVYARIDLRTADFIDVQDWVRKLISGKQTIVEVVSEYLRIRGKDYKLRALYPVLAGEVRHEGIAVSSDSIYRILWKNIECTLTPIGERSEYPLLYYNNGDLDIIPDSTVTYSTDYEKSMVPIWHWNAYSTDLCKYGPYMLFTGSYCSSDKSDDAYYPPFFRDKPAGWDLVTLETYANIEELHEKYNVYTEDRDEYNSLGYTYLIFDNDIDCNLYYMIESKDYGKNYDIILVSSLGYIAHGHTLFVRNSSFRY